MVRKSRKVNEGHMHPCPQCGVGVDCPFPLGDGDCGKLRCEACGPSDLAMAVSHCCGAKDGAYRCTLEKGHGGKEHIAHSSPEKIVHRWPMTLGDNDDDDGEPEDCENCGSDITEDNPVMDWSGDKRCKECWPLCESCHKTLDGTEYRVCQSCESLFCPECIRYCQCCDIFLCQSHSDGHGT